MIQPVLVKTPIAPFECGSNEFLMALMNRPTPALVAPTEKAGPSVPVGVYTVGAGAVSGARKGRGGRVKSRVGRGSSLGQSRIDGSSQSKSFTVTVEDNSHFGQSSTRRSAIKIRKKIQLSLLDSDRP